MSVFTDKAPWIMHNLIRDFDIGIEDAAAIVGNWGHESAGFTDLVEITGAEGGKGGLGWAQWTGPRRREYEAYCKRNGLDKFSDKANYGFAFTELKGSEKAALPKLKAASGLTNKTIAFERAFERAGVKHDDRRIDYAKLALDAYKKAVEAGKDLSLPWIADQPDDEHVLGSENPALWDLIVKLYYAILDTFKKENTMPKAIVSAPATAVVPVKSKWASKINWVAIPAALAGIAAVFGFDLDKEQLDTVVTVASGLFGAIAVLRTWFTESVLK